MTAELGHHILQQHHGVKSGKIQTGQKPLTIKEREKAKAPMVKKKDNRIRIEKQKKKRIVCTLIYLKKIFK